MQSVESFHSNTTPSESRESLDPIAGPSSSGAPFTTTTTTSAPLETLSRPAAARKKKLENDPWTADISIHSIKCLGCGGRVRLSTKSLYDNHHWNVHKVRCKKAGNMKDNGEPSQLPKNPVRKQKAKPNRKSKRATSSAPSSGSSLTPLSTPPLTTDNEEDNDLSSAEEPELPHRPTFRRLIKLDDRAVIDIEQYLARAHGISGLLPLLSDTETLNQERRGWNWSQLHVAVFPPPRENSPDSDGDDGTTIAKPEPVDGSVPGEPGPISMA